MPAWGALACHTHLNTSSAWPGRSMSSFLLRTSHTLSVLSLLPLTNRRLSADQATCLGGQGGAGKGKVGRAGLLGGSVSYRGIAWSSSSGSGGAALIGDAAAALPTLALPRILTQAPKGAWRALPHPPTWYTGPTCALKVATKVPLIPSHILTAIGRQAGRQAGQGMEPQAG